jgi:hypothetical protein
MSNDSPPVRIGRREFLSAAALGAGATGLSTAYPIVGGVVPPGTSRVAVHRGALRLPGGTCLPVNPIAVF